MFLGREKEKKMLNDLYEKDGFQFVVMYGRRRIGKTSLLLEFAKNKPHIFFVAEEYNKDRALANFSNQIYGFCKLKGLPAFSEWNEAFDFLIKEVGDEKIVLIMDEYPYLVGADKSISSIIQNKIDHKLLKTNIFFIVCGSSMSFMEKDVLSYKSPLYGRKTMEMKIEPFSFFEACDFIPEYGTVDKVISYGVLGGIPQYLKYFDDKISLKENIVNTILKKGSVLYDEPKNLLKQELREPMTYNTIIEAISTGSSKMNEIVTKTKMASDKCSKYIASLIELGIIQKENPVGEKPTRKSIYKLNDNLYKFWYRFVFHNINLTEQDEAEFLYESIINKEWSEYIGGYVFEDICKQYLLKCNKKRTLPFVFVDIGRWWGNDSIKKQQQEIDIVAVDKENAIFCECKWQNEKIDIKVLKDLKEKSRLLPFIARKYILFSKSGFTSKVVEYAKSDELIELIDLNILLS